MKKLSLSIIIASTFLLNGCAEEAPTFSILPESDIFFQSPGTLNNKIDILWVIDNSGSMQDEQNNLASNFNSFINSFSNKGYDYQIAVTTTEAWRSNTLAKFRDGTNSTSHTGVFVITPSTPNLINTFMINVTQGINGSGDERAFQSFRAALNNSQNAGFVRNESFLSVIIVSDEDDFSTNNTTSIAPNYNHASIHPISTYISYLDTLTQSTGALRRYSVSAIAIKDSTCAQANQASGGILAQRYIQIAAQTDGVVGDICAASYASTLDQIQNRIAELSTQFYLSRVPVVSTIVVHVSGVLIPQDETNGWTFNSAANSIVFHGNAIPDQGAAISVDYDPVSIK